MSSQMSEAYFRYVQDLESKLRELYAISDKAREKGIDPSVKTECKVAKDLADLVEGLVGPEGVAESIRDLSSKLPREELAFKIAEQIVYGKFGHMEPEAAAEQSIRTALAVLTEGLTAAPLQGVAKVLIKVNSDRSRYLAIYFAGPMRSAGGTDQALTLVVGDFVRRLLGLDRYKPTEEETSRFIEELRLYQRVVTRFQYHIPDEDLKKALQWIPVEVTGTESDPFEVSTFRNLPRIETNRVRGGALRVVNDGIVGRAPKVMAIVEKLGIQGWDWLKEFHKRSEKKSGGFMDDVIAGRPVFSFPSRRGGFRLRYGRARNTGLAAVGIHPVTMHILQGFLAGGTQVRLELPGKGGIVVPVDTLEPPIIRLKNDSVVKVTMRNCQKVKDQIEKILFLGDILVSFGDFLYNSQNLVPSGYVEEWWVEDLQRIIAERFGANLERAAKEAGTTVERLRSLMCKPFDDKPDFSEAVTLSSTLHVPLLPSFVYPWSHLTTVENVSLLRQWLLKSTVTRGTQGISRIMGENDADVKKALETVWLPHEIAEGKIIIENEVAQVYAFSLGLDNLNPVEPSVAKSPLEAISLMCGLTLKEKAPTFVGARMGRPEKAKRREMKPLVHVLFPVGLAGGSHRDIVQAAKHEPVFIEVVKRKCSNCGTYTFRIKCPACGCDTIVERNCPRCGKSLKDKECPACKATGVAYQKQIMNFRESLETASINLGIPVPKSLKCVKGLTNQTKTPEVIEKGILRAKHGLSVYKDGTIRFDATNAPLTHFKPTEIGVSVERMRQLGYSHAVDGKPLTDPHQICELRIQDIIIPLKCADYFMQIAAFMDELLARVYGLPPHYKLEQVEDVVGQMVVGLAPHTCAGILGRVIGFTTLNVCYAHPVWHSAKRRDCDGDEDAIMLALDTLINFSREYLPAQIGGIMDAPIMLIPIVITKEVQRQVHYFDVSGKYPTEFFEMSWERADSRQTSPIIDLVDHRLGTAGQFEGLSFTVPVSNINLGNRESSYKLFKTMVDKLGSQLDLAEKIEAVDSRKVAVKVLTKHFLRDIAGNLRAFSTQSFRCKSCNKRYRRLPLRGKCPLCGGMLALTVYRGGIEKYLGAAEHLIEKYDLPKYYAQRVQLMRQEIGAMFETKKPRQVSLTDFA